MRLPEHSVRTSSVLVTTNALACDSDTGIWFPANDVKTEFHYSDGVATEEYLQRVFSESTDLGSQSAELAAQIRDWPSEYHLSNKRANLLRTFDLSGISHALEVGCGCGAITRYLGECGIAVDAIEGSRSRAELAALRCDDLTGINVICANFNELELPESAYDAVFLVGVAEYAARFMGGDLPDEEALLALLRKTRRLIKPGGLVLIAIENRTGMKYVMGGHEDHYSLRYVGIHDYPETAGIRTYTHGEWLSLINRSGFTERETLFPFPDYKIPTVLLSESYATEYPFAFCQLEGVPSRDYVSLLDLKEAESVFWEAANSNGTFPEYANSYCMLLTDSRDTIDRVSGLDFAHLPDFGRKREFCVITKKYRGEGQVRRVSLNPGNAGERGADVAQLVKDEPFHHGPLLSLEWSRSLLLYPDDGRFEQLLIRYHGFLVERSVLEKGLNIDLLPNNIVVAENGDYVPFDEEWQVAWRLDPEFVFYRALLGFAMRYAYSLQSLFRVKELCTVRDFIEYGFRIIGQVAGPRIDEFVEQDNRFHAVVDVAPSPAELDSSIMSIPHVQPNVAKVYWCGADEDWSEERSTFMETREYDDRQTLVLDLPAEANRMSRWRFDPCDHTRAVDVGFLRIYGIEIKATRPGSRELDGVWRERGQERIAETGKMTGMAFQQAGLGEVFMVVSDDPHIEFEFSPRRRLREDEHLQVRIEMRLHRSLEYILARDLYMVREEAYVRRLRYLDDVDREKQRLEEELALIKSSKVWRLAEKFRGLVYVSLLPRARRAGDIFRERGVREALSYLRRGLYRRWGRFRGIAVPPDEELTPYERWFSRHAAEFPDPAPREASRGPKVSLIMPVYNTDPDILRRAIASVESQQYSNWELCIADDCSTNKSTGEVLHSMENDRVHVRYLDSNLGIAGATRTAVESATGDYLAFLDHDDELAPWALMEMVRTIRKSDAELLYSDEDFIRTDTHLDFPHFKPNYSPDLLLSHNYITHLLVIKRTLYEEVGGIRDGFDGAQDYDLVLRAVERARNVVHVPSPLYHWRMSANSTSLNPQIKPGVHENARRALQDTLVRRNIDGEVMDGNLDHYFRVKRSIRGGALVSIVLPFKDNPGLLKDCIETVLELTSYQHFEIVGVSNDTMSPTTFDLMRDLEGRDSRVRFVDFDVPFNFSRVVNFGVSQGKGEHIVLLNNDIEIITPEWLENLLEHSQREEVAAVGGKLYYPNNTIQHAGIVIGLGGYAGHAHKNFPASSDGYFNRLNVIQNVSAVTGALLMTSRQVYEDLGGFDEEAFGVAYNDVDFCLRARERGLLNVFTPYVEAYHHESISRGYEDTLEKQQRFRIEMSNLLERHGERIKAGDPYYNANLDQGRDDFSLPSV